MRPFIAIVALAAQAAGQDWGTQGSWELVVPVPTQPGAPIVAPTRAYHHATWQPGYLVMAGNDTSAPGGSGAPDLYLFNIAASQWTAPFAYITTTPLRQPFIFSQGGYVAAVDEGNPNVVYTVDASQVTGSWAATSVSSAPVGRFAQRFLSWGSTVYMFGGFDPVALVQYNDMYALDLNTALAGQPASWVQVSPAAVNGVVPGYPAPRIGYSIVSYQIGAVLFGGLSNTAPGSSPFDCFRTPAAPTCFFHTHVHVFLPGLGNPKAANGMPAGAWLDLSPTGANGGPMPTGRVEHVAGAMGDQMYVYGGMTATGPSTELWTFNLVSQTWALCSQGSPAPPAPGLGFGWAAGAVIGRHLYIYSQEWQSTTPGQLWRWAPSASFGGPASASSSGVSSAVVMGHTAGIAITVLLCSAILAVTLLSAQQTGAVPNCCSLSFSWSAPKISPAGFYGQTLSKSAVATSAGGYVAPPEQL